MGKNGTFSHFCKLLQCKNFQEVSVGAIWKLTYWRFRKCGSFLFYNFLNQTYGCSKSTESEILSLSSKLMRRNKNKYGYNFPFQVLPFNQPKNIPIGSTLIEYGSLKLKIVRVFIFVTPPLCKKKFLRFDPTLGSNNSGLKNYSILNHHIFGKPWTSAFSWYTPFRSYWWKSLRKMRFRFSSFHQK